MKIIIEQKEPSNKYKSKNKIIEIENDNKDESITEEIKEDDEILTLDETRIRKRLSSILRRQKYKRDTEDGKELIEINQDYEEFYSKAKGNSEDNQIWTTNDPTNVETIKEKPASCDYSDEEPIELFRKLFTDELLDEIVECTNERISVEKDINVYLSYFTF